MVVLGGGGVLMSEVTLYEASKEDSLKPRKYIHLGTHTLARLDTAVFT